MVKRPILVYDFKAFGTAIKPARKKYGKSRKKVSNEPFILAILQNENNGQQSTSKFSMTLLLVTTFRRTVFLSNDTADKSMQW